MDKSKEHATALPLCRTSKLRKSLPPFPCSTIEAKSLLLLRGAPAGPAFTEEEDEEDVTCRGTDATAAAAAGMLVGLEKVSSRCKR